MDGDKPSPNVALLTATLEYIKAHPEEWDQKTWRCGTTACFAGHAVKQAGARWVNQHEVITSDGRKEFIDEYASEILGLNRTESYYLFDACNTLEDLERIVAALAAGQQDNLFAAEEVA